ICTIVTLALLPSQVRDFMRAGHSQKKVREAALTVVTGAYNTAPMMFNFWMPDPRFPIKFAPYLRKHDLSVFRFGWAHWEGEELGGTESTDKRIRGGLLDSGRKDHGWWIQGW